MNTFNTIGKTKKHGDNNKSAINHNYSASSPNVAEMKQMGDRNLVGPYHYVDYHTSIAYTGQMVR